LTRRGKGIIRAGRAWDFSTGMAVEKYTKEFVMLEKLSL
jgi:hypothetical protein